MHKVQKEYKFCVFKILSRFEVKISKVIIGLIHLKKKQGGEIRNGLGGSVYLVAMSSIYSIVKFLV